MTIARYKDLCLDTNDIAVSGPFWRQVLGATLVSLADGDARLDPGPGRPANEVIWVNVVPEPRTVKTRVHLDIRLADPEPTALVEAGASISRAPDGEISFWVMADPEGNEFCAFPAAEGTQPGAFNLVVDCRDSLTQARWWAGVVGGTVGKGKRAYWVEGAEGFPWVYWGFNPVPEPKVVKNRMHWDVELTDPEPTALVEAGAVVLREPGADISWWVMADPEGNEFCAFAPPA
jgi:catechol 2,3-dioxygenase-like lactoylglutathione lyase family enzyme